MPTQTVAREKGCDFFSSTPSNIFVPEDFLGDERLMVDAAEQFSRKEVLSIVDRLEKQEDGLMPGLIRKAGELGFCGADSPEAYGGLGLGKNLAARMLEFLSLNASFSVTIGVTSGIAQVGLTLFGNESQKQKYIPRLASGEWIGAYALSEPNSGTDALALATRADLRDGKWVLNGTKMWISNAKWANSFLVIAKVAGEKVTAFIVERDMPGVTIAREEHKLGLKGSSTARLILDDAIIPQENMLYEEGKGHHVAFNALNLGRFKLAAMSLGPARDALGHAAIYARDRKQFGQPISNFGLVRKKFAEMAARHYTAESMLYRTGANIDAAFSEFAGTIEGNRAAAEECAVECSACKVFATEAEAFIVDESFQVYGGYGFTEEFPLARIYRDCRVSRIYEGTNEINRVFVADRMIRRAKDGRSSIIAVGDSFVSELAGIAFTKCAEKSRDCQITLGALSDLAILAYAEQSARLRALRFGGLHQEACNLATNWINAEAVKSFQIASGNSVTIPDSAQVDYNALAEETILRAAPL